jgi:glutamine amidotransferase
VAIVDYGLSNLDSVRRALEKLSARPYVVSHARDLAEPDRIVLPGVGAFPDAMENLVARGFDTALTEQVAEGVPLLGICLGMQLLATKGTEGTPTPGLGWIAGEIARIEPPDPDTRVPHVGWNEVIPAPTGPLFDGVPEASDFYFVHSYHFVPDDPASVAATTPYAGGIVSAVQGPSGPSERRTSPPNVFGVQFHPEKSQTAGFRVLANFLGV